MRTGDYRLWLYHRVNRARVEVEVPYISYILNQARKIYSFLYNRGEIPSLALDALVFQDRDHR